MARKHKTKLNKKVQASKSKTRSGRSTLNKHWLIVLVISVAVWYPSLNNGFVYWDDDKNILENTNVTTFRPGNILENTHEIFTSTVIGNYNPLPILTFGIENAIFGIENPFYWHLNNLLLHLIAVFLVFRIGALLGLSGPGTFILALLFAIHPMRVESVAWITERKDVLYGVFFLAAIHQYIQYTTHSKRWMLVSIYIFFVLSLLSKIQAVALPLVFILIDLYKGKKLSVPLIFKQWPFFILSFITGVAGIYFLKAEGSLASTSAIEPWQRIFIGSWSFMIYLIKSIIPFRLSPLYPYPAHVPWYFIASIVIFPMYFWGMYYTWKKGLKVLFFGMAFFFFNIVFMIQILGAGQGFLADRFTYIAYFGLFFIIAHYTAKALESNKYKKLIPIALTMVFIGYGWITHQQCKIWKDSETLWTHVLKYYQKTTLPFHNRGNYYRDNGMTLKALEDYSAAISLDPSHANTFNSRAKLYFTLAKSADTLQLALNDYNKAIQLSPENGEFYINRGATYARLGNRKQAFEDINYGLELKPNQASGYLNRFVLYYQDRQYNKALADIERYLDLDPNNPDFWYERGNINVILGRVNDTVLSYLNRAIAMDPTKAQYHYKKGEALAELNRLDEARQSMMMAAELGHQSFRGDIMEKLDLPVQ